MNREKSSSYPATTWAECKSLLERFSALGLSVVSADELAKEYGLSNSRTKSFQYRLSTARQYGLVDVRSHSVSITELGRDILHPVEEDIRRLELQCFANPPLHKALLQKFDAKPLPRIDLFENILVKEFGIAEGAKKRAAECFVATATELKVLVGGVFCYAKALEGIDAREADQETSFDGGSCKNEGLEDTSSSPARRGASTDAIVQRIPLESGGVLEFSIPVTATTDDLLLARDIFDILLKRRFGVDKS